MFIKYLKIVLSGLLLLCLADMPYGYFQFVRFSSTIMFAYFAIMEHEEQNEVLTIAYAALAILFQPFYKIALGGNYGTL